MDDAGASEVRVTMSKTEVRPQIREPAATPGPVGEQWVGKGAHDEGGDDERGIFPPFRARAGDDCKRCVHEHHLEQEQHHGKDVISSTVREEISALTPQTERLAEEGYHELTAEDR